MDTGPINSHDDLGIDAIPSERVTLRKVASCAPMHMKPYSTIQNITIGGGDYVDEFLQLNIGEFAGASGNWTFEYNLHASLVNIGYDIQ